MDPQSSEARRVIEVYPHPATVAIFRLGCTLKYKRGRGQTPDERFAYRKNEMLKLIKLIENLATASLPMQVTTHDGWITLRQSVEDASRPFQLDLAEDQIDAVLCAYIAKIFGAQNTGRPQETFSNAPGKSNAIRRSSARPKSSSPNMIGWGARSA